MSVQFLASVFADSLKHPNFFNGRVLTAADLRDEQAASVRRGRCLGQAAGEGVVSGLYVTRISGGKALQITGGLAISRSGDTLHLPGQATTVELAIQTPLEAGGDSPFAVCAPAGGVTLTGAVATGFYLLAITSAARLSPELASHSGLNGGATSCINRYEEIGVQFKLIPLTNADLIAPIGATSPLRRSQLAHACFGTAELAAVQADPLRAPAQYGLLDRLRDGRLTDCDVPLAVFQFWAGGVDFVDVWSVRRPCAPGVRPGVFPSSYSAALTEVFTSFAGPRRAGEAVAFLLQFQKQLEDLRTDSGVNPLNAAASTYFDYLPAAGYLPISAQAAQARRFRVASFFGQPVSPTELDPAYLRSVLHESFYVEPIPVSDRMDVDVFEVPGARTDEPYIIFARRVSRVPPAVDGPPEDILSEEETLKPEQRTGNLQVTVLDEDGSPLPVSAIASVRAINQQTGQSYQGKPRSVVQAVGGSYQQRQYADWLEESQRKVRVKYRSGASGSSRTGSKPDQLVIYVFNSLPAGNYTVDPVPAQAGQFGVSKSVAVRSGAVAQASVVIRSLELAVPDDRRVVPPERIGLPWGVLIEKFYLDTRWTKIWPQRDTGIPYDPGYVDPAPDDWYYLEDTPIQARIEEILGGEQGGANPLVAADDAEIYIRRGYNPAGPAVTADAFVQTRDGTRFPLVVVAADNALGESAAVTRTEIADFDAATFNQLQVYGLGDLEALGSAPAGLVGAVLGQSVSYAASLIEDARQTLADDFQNGFMSHPGVSKAASDALKTRFGDRVGVANAAPGAIAEAIASVKGGDAAAWGSFSARLLDTVQATVPMSAYNIAMATGISADGLAALGAAGIHSNQGLLDAAGSAAGRTALKAALKVNDAALDRYTADALLSIAQGQFVTAPEKSVAALHDMAPELAADLADKGVYSARDLANSDAAALAQGSRFSEAEMRPLVATAASYSRGYSTLIRGATSGKVTGEALAGAGFLSAGSLAKADRAELEQVAGMTPGAAKTLSDLSGRFMDVVRGGTLGGGL